MAIACAAAASLIIVVNAMFLQSGAHPAPFFANPAIATAADRHSMPRRRPAPCRSRRMRSPRVQLPACARLQPRRRRRNDPIAELIERPVVQRVASRITAVQRALSEYGYGQIKPSGMLDEPTSEAIEKFETRTQNAGDRADVRPAGRASLPPWPAIRVDCIRAQG